MEDREKDGKMTSMISSNKFLKKRKMKNQSKEAIKPTIIGSTLPKTGEDGLFEKEITQGRCKNDRRQRYNQKIKRRRDDDFEQSSSSANALRTASSYLKYLKAVAAVQWLRAS